MTELRDYQHQAVSDLRKAVSHGSRAPLLQMATGMGKTLAASAIIQSSVAKGKRVLVLSPRRQIVWQTQAKLRDFGVPAGIIMAGERPSLMPDVQIASVPTLYRRCFEDGEPVTTEFGGRGMPLPPAELVVVDEAHATFSTMAQTILAAYPKAVKIGMTATPSRADGRGLGEVYDSIVTGPSVRWAMDNGYLSELRYFGPGDWDLSEVPMQAGDYHQSKLADAVNKPKLIGDVVDNWQRIAPDRTTVVFAVDRKHARALHEAFSPVTAVEYIDGQTEHEQRQEIFKRLESGETRVLCSVAVVDMGWDLPAASCAILARPTKSVARYLQAVGRVLRPAPGKQDAILIDHTGAVADLGFVDDDFEWTLDGVEKSEAKPKSEAAEKVTVNCPGCKALIRPAPQCPECGMEMKQAAKRAIEAKEAELHEITRKERKRYQREWSMDDKARLFGELKAYASQKGYKQGFAAHSFRDRTGVWPNDKRIKNAAPIPPSAETLAWLKHRQIKRAKSKQAA